MNQAQVITTAAEWLGKLWPIILAGVMGIVGVFIGYRLNARRSARLEHLNAIKAQVFRPLREELERFYLPLLQEELGPVTIEPKLRNLGGSINDPSVRWEYPLAPRRNAAPKSIPFLTERQEEQQGINVELYKDTKSQHFTVLMNRLQTFKDGVDDYCTRGVLYAEHPSRAIAGKTALPLIKAESGGTDINWVDANRLAIFTLNWQLGIVLHAPWVSPGGLSLEIDGQMVARVENHEAIQKVRDALEAISKDRGRLEELRQPLPALRQEGTELLRELERLLFSSRLPGRCPFAKM